MSDTLEIVEITDSSIIVSPENKNTTTTKRQLESDNEELADIEPLEQTHQLKKIRSDDNKTDEIVNESASKTIDDTLLCENKVLDATVDDDCKIDLCESDIMEQNVFSGEKSSLLEEVEEPTTGIRELILPRKSNDSNELTEGYAEEEIDDELGEEESSVGEHSYGSEGSEEEEDDDALMARAMMATQRHKTYNDDDEPIALDSDEDEDDGNGSETQEHHNESENSSEFSVNNRVLSESDDSDGFAIKEKKLAQPTSRYHKLNPELSHSKKIIKKSRRMFWMHIPEKVKRLNLHKAGTASTSKNMEENAPPIEPLKIKKSVIIEKTKELSSAGSDSQKPPVSSTNEQPPTIIETADVSIQEEKQTKMEDEQILESLPNDEVNQMEVDSLIENKSTVETEKLNSPPQKALPESQIQETAEEEIQKNPESIKSDEQQQPITKDNDQTLEENTLLAEISSGTVEEIFNRYVCENSDNQPPTLEEFSEELFYCLQQNKVEIIKAQQLWNEKIHVKYKIRELMERIRRHRAVLEIETCGFKPSQENAVNNSRNPVISSKSSTTTNSENDLRITNESVTRLIHDVRASMLKRDEKQRTDGMAAASSSTASVNDSYPDNSSGFNTTPSALSNAIQSSLSQGRQGPIIDVQSIINDFRQKNPQEIPRRGRRMKNSFDGGSLYNEQQDDNMSNNFMMKNNSNGDYNDLMKSNRHSGGYPEVSLLPVQNFYKNLTNSAGSSASGSGLYGDQKSSLLQSILTKQSTKSPITFHQNHGPPTTSTLARLLTAPERSVQNTSRQTSTPASRNQVKVHNNGEITITPIAINSSRKQGYSMDDDDNSQEPPLVIDESEDFELNDRQNQKSMSDLLCQGCKKNKARFMCAGCSRQWYCSKECQEVAWDDHAENCMV